jgi:hypothetical protein
MVPAYFLLYPDIALPTRRDIKGEIFFLNSPLIFQNVFPHTDIGGEGNTLILLSKWNDSSMVWGLLV